MPRTREPQGCFGTCIDRTPILLAQLPPLPRTVQPFLRAAFAEAVVKVTKEDVQETLKVTKSTDGEADTHAETAGSHPWRLNWREKEERERQWI